MREQFEDFNFRAATLAVIENANEIIDEYQQDGLTLTLRQLYYQFVSRDLIPNNQKSYNKLGNVISNARLAGLIDWSAIEDRTRFLRGLTNWSSPSQMIEYYASDYSIDMWKNQDVRLEVWIEKDALLGVIEQVCRDNDVDYFACRGYVSQSELYEAGKRIERYRIRGQETIVIHMGDHDPSGIDMTRDNQERLSMFSGDEVQVNRIALNYDQVLEYSPPPNPTKLSDSRANGYIENHGYSSWELDALNPRTLRDLIQSEINRYKDVGLWAEREAVLADHQTKLDHIVEDLSNEYD